MIAVYAQSTRFQGLEAAIDGRLIDSQSEIFRSVRETASRLNLRSRQLESGALRIACSATFVRLQIDLVDHGEKDEQSPVVIVLEARDNWSNLLQLRVQVEGTLEAIGRSVDRELLLRGLEKAMDLMVQRRRERVLGVIASSAALLVIPSALVATLRRSRLTPARKSRRK